MFLADLISVVPGLMVWTVIAFGITFFLLRRLAFGRIQAIIDARRDRIREALDEADKARHEARQLRELTLKERKSVNIPVWMGLGAVVVGAILLVPRRRS